MPTWWRKWSLMWWWAAGVVWIVAINARGADSSTRRRHAVDTRSSLMLIVGMMALEMAVALAILRPWSGRRSVDRALAALAVLGVWTLVVVGPSMHGSPAVVLHVLWLMLTDVILLAAVVARIVGQRQRS
jgi:hypothetical protein